MNKSLPRLGKAQTVEKLQFFDKYARRHKWLWAREF